MVPGVPLAVIGRVGGIAMLLLLGDEGPLLIELDLARPGGESPATSSVPVAGVRAGKATQPAHGVAIGPAEAPGLAGAAPLGDVFRDREGLLGREPEVEAGRALSLGEAGLSGTLAEHAAGLLGSVVAGHGQVPASRMPRSGQSEFKQQQCRRLSMAVSADPIPRLGRRLRTSAVITVGEGSCNGLQPRGELLHERAIRFGGMNAEDIPVEGPIPRGVDRRGVGEVAPP